ncbi:MAG: alpha/beta hydrolase [Lachnospiraceae bacterium]|nr:alpha/beta hydrolase [Lachnospiraceae bacterium]
MSIAISDEMRKCLDERQEKKFAAIRKEAIYDREIRIPVRGAQIRCLEYAPRENGQKLPVIFDMHGGGFTNGYPEEDDLMCRQMCDRLQARVFSIDYRLAPEFPYPEGQLDVYETIRYFAVHEDAFQIRADQMITIGHSAGANYALPSAMRACEEHAFSLRGIILDYPPLDMVTPTKDKFYTEGCIPMELSDLFNACYCLPEQAGEPFCSPAFAPDELLRCLPPVTILPCEIDSLRDEAEQFGLRLARLRVEVTLRRYVGLSHAFNLNYDLPASQESIDMMVRQAGKYLQ